jgi:hypothetical protein
MIERSTYAEGTVGGRAHVVNARREVEATLQLAGVDDILLGSSATTNDAA